MTTALLHRLTFISVLIFNSISAQDFTWIKGTNLVDQKGQYGTIGTPAPSNNPGGRDGAATWTDLAGNFWLFGGTGFDDNSNNGDLSDLWKYDITSNQWTYINGNIYIAQFTQYTPIGIPSAFAKPGARHNSASWTDASGNLWLFGGYGLAGGSGIGYLNDLWKYNISSNQWTYVNGGSYCYQPGVYGTMGVPASTNTPGARQGGVTWTNAGDLWLMGGYGNSTSSVTIGSMNDVWRYNIANNEWTWMKGTNLIDQNGIYGALGTSAAANCPGGRSLSTGWVDPSGNFWLFGGDGWDATATTNTGLLNDLWKYNTSTNEWTWVKGSIVSNQIGAYGLLGVSNATNIPGSRSGSISWRDGVGNYWLFAGQGYPGSTSPAGGLNDLWKYNMTTNEWMWVKGGAIINQNGTYGSQGVAALSNNPGGRSQHAGWIDAPSNDLYFFGGQGQAASGAAGALNDLWKYTNCFISPITMTIVSKDTSICAGESTSLTATGSSNYLWLNNNTPGSFLVISPTLTTTYSVVTADAKGCRYTASFIEIVSTCAGISQFTETNSSPVVYPNPSNGVFNISSSGLNDKNQLVIFNSLGQNVFEQILSSNETLVKTGLSKGIYYFQFKQSEKNISTGKLVVE